MNDLEAIRTAIKELRADVDRLKAARREDEAGAAQAMEAYRAIGIPDAIAETLERAGM
jgi:hypothetical protein